MCRDAEIDAVFVGTPNQFHVPVALEAIENGKHVMVTKPLADSVDAAKRLVEVAEASGLVNMMSLSTRFAPEVRYLGGAGQRSELYVWHAPLVMGVFIINTNRKNGAGVRDDGVVLR